MNFKREKILFWGWPAVIAGAVFLLDLITKEVILLQKTSPRYSGHIATVFEGFFDIVRWFNTGGAWGILHNHTEILTLISLFFGSFLIFKFRVIHENHIGKACAFSLLIGGIWGNFFDRAFRLSQEISILHPVEMFIGQWSSVLSGEALWGRGAVIDFLFFHCQIKDKFYGYPAFNIADIAICIGVGMLVFFTFFFSQDKDKSEPSSES